MSQAFITAALAAAEAAARVIRAAYRGPFEVRYKADASPVTEVDVAAERAIKQVLGERFPEHGFYGEELGRERADAEYLWLIDPIDGTKGFVRGYPLFSVQIALMHHGRIIAGVSHAPCWQAEGDAAGETLWAAAGAGAWRLRPGATGAEDALRLQVADTREVARATLSTGNLASLAGSPAWARFGALVPQLHRIRGYGDFLHYHWLADGRLDAVVESDVNILDIAALSLIVEEAGGRFTDLAGAAIGLETRSVLASSPALHAPLLAAIGYGST